jgi:hypothetical protein
MTARTGCASRCRNFFRATNPSSCGLHQPPCDAHALSELSLVSSTPALFLCRRAPPSARVLVAGSVAVSTLPAVFSFHIERLGRAAASVRVTAVAVVDVSLVLTFLSRVRPAATLSAASNTVSVLVAAVSVPDSTPLDHQGSSKPKRWRPSLASCAGACTHPRTQTGPPHACCP